MKRLSKLVSAALTLIPSASAQITGGGVAGTDSVTGLISHLLGIQVGEPYQLLGFMATFGLMWVSTYVIFKIGVRKIDEGLESGGFADALGISREDDRNLLAVLTLLVTMSIIGTGAFAGMIRGWQSLILLAFVFMLLAGLIFILLGGTGAILGGGSYITGKSAKVTARGVEEAASEIDSIMAEEDQVRDLEEGIDNEERDAERREREDEDDGGSSLGSSGGDDGSGGSSTTEREIEDVTEKLERAIQLINDIENRMNHSIRTELDNLKDDVRDLERLLALLGIRGGHRGAESVENIVQRLEASDSEKERLLSLDTDPEDAGDIFESILENYSPYPVTPNEMELLSGYINDLEEARNRLDRIEKNTEIYREIQELLEELEEELNHASEEEKYLEKLVSNLEEARSNRELIEQVKHEKGQLDQLRNKIGRIEEMDYKLQEFEEKIKGIEDKLGGMDALRNATKTREVLAGELKRFGTDDMSSAKFIGFGDSSGAEAVLRPGMTIFSSGKDGTTLRIDTDMSAGGHTSEKYFEFDEKSEGLIRRFISDINSYIRSSDIKGKKDVPEEMMKLFSMVNQEIHGLSGDGGSKKIVMSSAFRSLRFDSHLLNAVYLGFLAHNFRQIYDHRVVESDIPESHIGAWRPVREVLEDAYVSIGVYMTGSGAYPCTFVDTEGLGFCFCPATGETITGIEQKRIQEVLYSFDS